MLAIATSLSAAYASQASRTSGDPLVGTWDTKPIPLAKLRSALKARGYSTAETDKMFKSLAFLYHIKKSIQYEISFYRDNGVPFQYVTYWDPAPPAKRADPAHGPYKLLPGSRVSYVGTDPPTDTYRTTFTYSVRGKTLTLHYVSLAEPGLSAVQRRSDAKLPILQAVAPYTKVA